jgi:hypothetical protein
MHDEDSASNHGLLCWLRIPVVFPASYVIVRP